MTSRPMLVVFVLIIFIITSQFDWKQQLATDAELSPNVSQKQLQISKREEAVKEKIILSQEKNIQKLNELVRTLREELRQCTSGNESTNGSSGSLGDALIDLDRRPLLED